MADSVELNCDCWGCRTGNGHLTNVEDAPASDDEIVDMTFTYRAPGTVVERFWGLRLIARIAAEKARADALRCEINHVEECNRKLAETVATIEAKRDAEQARADTAEAIAVVRAALASEAPAVSL